MFTNIIQQKGANMSKKCKIAVIGVGQRGYAYVSMLKNHKDVELSALCDTSPERLKCFAEELNCQDIPKFHSVDELLQYAMFDAVVITTPDFTHRECAVKAFAAGKHVMLEKPMAPTAAECREIISAAQKSGKQLQIGFVLRHHPVFQGVMKELKKGTIGQLLSINCSESIGVMHGASYMRRWHRKSVNSGGFLLAKCSHDLDLMSDFADSLPSKVSSFGGTSFFTPSKQKAAFCSECSDEKCRFRFHGEMVRMTPDEKASPSEKSFDLCVYNADKDVVDNQQVIFEYANGVRGTFSLNLFAPAAKREWRLVGSCGYIDADTSQRKYTVSFSDGREKMTVDCPVTNASGHDGSDMLFLENFINGILDGKPLSAEARTGLYSTVIGNAIEKARLSGTVVTIAPEEYQ